MTYEKLETCVKRVATWLCRHAVASGCTVALQLYRSHELAVGVLGALTSGGAYLPLDPQWPLQRRTFMVEDGACARRGLGGWYRGDDGSGISVQLTAPLRVPLLPGGGGGMACWLATS